MTDRGGRYGALCSGIGGLELAVEQVFGFRPAWHAEIDRDASLIHERHWPGLPNVGDITTADWDSLEPVELICAGYPCQPFSHAGARRGEDDDRHLWPHVAEAVRVLRPRWVVLENVAGHLSLGFGAVLGDLAEAGYDAEWVSLRASDVGATHRRQRVFVVAADATGNQGRISDRNSDSPPDPDDSTDHGQWSCPQPWGGSEDAPDTDGGRQQIDGEPHGGSFGPAQRASRRTDPDGCDASAADPQGEHEHGSGRARRRGAEPTDRSRVASDPACFDGEEPAWDAWASGLQEQDRGSGGPAWGGYEPAIRRWEVIFGRPAPDPVDGRRRLAVPFVEWMQGYPSGWVDGLSRTAALRALGNAVVPQQGAAALAVLLDAWQEAA